MLRCTWSHISFELSRVFLIIFILFWCVDSIKAFVGSGWGGVLWFNGGGNQRCMVHTTINPDKMVFFDGKDFFFYI